MPHCKKTADRTNGTSARPQAGLVFANAPTEINYLRTEI